MSLLPHPVMTHVRFHVSPQTGRNTGCGRFKGDVGLSVCKPTPSTGSPSPQREGKQVVKYRIEMTIDTPDWGPGETLEKVQSAMLLAYPAKLWHISVITEQRAIDEGRAWLRDLVKQDG